VAENVRIKGVEELRGKLKKLGDKQERKVTRTAIRKAGNLVLKNARKRAPKKSGRLRKGLAVRVSVTTTGETVRIGAKRRAGARHAHLIELGTKPHVITTRRGKILASPGHIYGRRVNHPGIPAQPFLMPAFEESKDDAVDFFKDEMKRLIKSLKV
jgi:HK97 gp10 family phage protein